MNVLVTNICAAIKNACNYELLVEKVMFFLSHIFALPTERFPSIYRLAVSKMQNGLWIAKLLVSRTTAISSYSNLFLLFNKNTLIVSNALLPMCQEFNVKQAKLWRRHTMYVLQYAGTVSSNGYTSGELVFNIHSSMFLTPFR